MKTHKESIKRRIEFFHTKNGEIIDLMNEGKLSPKEAKILLQINSDEIKRLQGL